MEMKRFEYIATLAFDAYTQEEADEMLQEYLEDEVNSGLEYPDSWALDPTCDGAQEEQRDLMDIYGVT